MEEGLENDDVFMMVEGKYPQSQSNHSAHANLDEFLRVAKKFTKHIHQAALNEMEKKAKTKSHETIAAITRPVSIAMPAGTKRKLQTAAGAKKRGDGVQKLLSALPGGAEDDDDPDAVPAWVGTSLHGLSK